MDDGLVGRPAETADGTGEAAPDVAGDGAGLDDPGPGVAPAADVWGGQDDAAHGGCHFHFRFFFKNLHRRADFP